MPLCDQLCFLYAWLRKERPGALRGGVEGEWWLDEKSGYTGVCDGRRPSPSRCGIPAIQPCLAEPLDEALLQSMREALETFLLRHLESVDSAAAAQKVRIE